MLNASAVQLEGDGAPLESHGVMARYQVEFINKLTYNGFGSESPVAPTDRAVGTAHFDASITIVACDAPRNY